MVCFSVLTHNFSFSISANANLSSEILTDHATSRGDEEPSSSHVQKNVNNVKSDVRNVSKDGEDVNNNGVHNVNKQSYNSHKDDENDDGVNMAGGDSAPNRSSKPEMKAERKNSLDLDFDCSFSDDDDIFSDVQLNNGATLNQNKNAVQLKKQENVDNSNSYNMNKTEVAKSADRMNNEIEKVKKVPNRQASETFDELNFDLTESGSENEADENAKEEDEEERLNQSIKDLLGPEYPRVTSPRQLPPLASDQRTKSRCGCSPGK